MGWTDEEEGVRRVLVCQIRRWMRRSRLAARCKRELVLDLRGRGLARKMQDGQLRGRIVASARHLGNQDSWNGRNGSGLTLRLRAAHIAW